MKTNNKLFFITSLVFFSILSIFIYDRFINIEVDHSIEIVAARDDLIVKGTDDLSWPIECHLDYKNYVPSLFETFAIQNRPDIVKTINYEVFPTWKAPEYAWLSHYAVHYKTTTHFIRRSCGKPYTSGDLEINQKFNVLRDDIGLEFKLVVDLSRSKMLFFYKTTSELGLLNIYDVVLGARDHNSVSHSLTPLGIYSLGMDEVNIHKKGDMVLYDNKEVESIEIFGTRWIPFKNEISGCSKPAKGYGIHGYPIIKNVEVDVEPYSSLGCIRMKNQECEELFSIILTKPTEVELLLDYHHSNVYQRYIDDKKEF